MERRDPPADHVEISFFLPPSLASFLSRCLSLLVVVVVVVRLCVACGVGQSQAGVEQAQGAGTADAVVSILSRDPKVFLSLFAVTSVMAPLLEEVVFRGFMLTTLTKWMPAPTAAFVSAGLFGAAHLTSRDFAQLTALGVVLGLTYVRTKNLATPMLIHAFWNSGVLILLELLFLAGYDVNDLLK